MFTNAQLVAMAVSAAVSVVLPLLLLAVWRKKTGASLKPALVGGVLFFLFAMVLEQLLHLLVLRPGGYVLSHAWAYCLYGALAAGVFEETARLVGFRFLLKKQTGWESSVMHGIGHGGTEAILVGGANAALFLAVGLMTNAGQAVGELALIADTVLPMTPGNLLLIGVERMIALAFHVALSVLVFVSVRRPGKRWLYPAAIGLHAMMDIPAAAYQAGVLSNVYVVEMLLAAFVVLVWIPAVKLLRQEAERENC